MKALLTTITVGPSGDVTKLSGDMSGLSGDASGRLEGGMSHIRGDVTGVIGDVDSCEITTEEREGGIDIKDLILQ